jgi:hypothetical protein
MFREPQAEHRSREDRTPCRAPSQESAMSHLAAFLASVFVTGSSAWATTTSPTPTTPPATTGGGIADYWWLILVVIVVAAAIWYYTRRNKTSV